MTANDHVRPKTAQAAAETAASTNSTSLLLLSAGPSSRRNFMENIGISQTSSAQSTAESTGMNAPDAAHEAGAPAGFMYT